MMNAKWIIDQKIDLVETCEKASWHMASCIDALIEQGLSRSDAEAYTSFAFADKANQPPEDHVTDEQWDRML